jgi:hypothetical protein
MKANVLFLIFLLLGNISIAQNAYDLEEGKPFVLNGIEYGISIKNEQKREFKNEPFTRFELRAYVTNKSGCSKLMLPNKSFLSTDYQDVVADFDCINATGKRLTAKTAKVRAKELTAPYRFTTKGTDGKDISNTVSVKVGHMLRNGETISNNFTVIVAEGQRPQMRVVVREFD